MEQLRPEHRGCQCPTQRFTGQKQLGDGDGYLLHRRRSSGRRGRWNGQCVSVPVSLCQEGPERCQASLGGRGFQSDNGALAHQGVQIQVSGCQS
jgi:hypothetical protein